MPLYKSAAEILTSISQIQWATQGVQGNRSKINRLMNGDAPWTEEERKANRLNTNINWLEGPRIVKNSAYQLVNAFFGPGDYFTLSLDTSSVVPIWARDSWSASLTAIINKALRDSRLFESTLEQAVAQVVLHGPGPSLWRKKHQPIPETAGVDDVLVPAGTLADMSNLNFFAVYREWTWAQLRDMTHGKAVDKGWNVPYVDALLRSLYKQPLQPLYQGNRWLFPEKIAEDDKENTNSFTAAALGRVLAWDAYFLNEDTGKWNRRILLDYNNVSPEGLRTEFSPDRQRPDFLFQADDYANDWRHLIHWFIGNCSTVAPYRYYSIRSIGYQLYGSCFAQNMVRCRHADHVLQTLLTWFRNVSEDDRERLEDIQLHHLGIFPDGVSMVTAQERYTADWNLVGNFLTGNRQLMAESSAAYLPDIATEGEKPAMTATESLIRNNASVTLTSSVQNQLYRQAKDFFTEIVRRICLKDDRDPVVKQVLDRMKRHRIPPAVLDPDAIEVTPNRVMGGGNRAVELTTARALFEAKGAFGATADLPIRRKYMLALTNDPEFVRAALPDEPTVSKSVLAAQYAFGTLMEGVPVAQSGLLNELEYVDTLLQLVALAMKPLEALQEQPSALAIASERIAGLVNACQHIEEHIAKLSQDPQAKQAVRDAQRMVNQLMGQLRAYAERITEMEQAQQPAGGLDAATAAKVQSIQATTQAKIQSQTAVQQTKLQHKDIAFQAEEERKDAATVAEIRRKSALTQADVASKDLTTRADLIHQARQADAERQETAIDRQQDRQEEATDRQHDRVESAADSAQERLHTEAGHQQEMRHGEEQHATELEHATEKHEVDLKATKAKAAAARKSKPKAK